MRLTTFGNTSRDGTPTFTDGKTLEISCNLLLQRYEKICTFPLVAAMKLKTSLKHTSTLAGALTLVLAPLAFPATIIPVTSFNPNTFFDGGITAGIDFDVDSSGDPGAQYVTQPGFLSVPATATKDYNVTHNGITFDIKTINANQANQARWRNNASAGGLMNDFQQWYGSYATSGNQVTATVTLTGLAADTDYQISFFTYNVGAGQTTHSFYEGASSAAPLITTFATAGNQNDYSTWRPGITFQINSGSDSEIAVTVQALEFISGSTFQSRLTVDGIAVTAIPEPSSIALLGLGGLAIVRRRRK